MRQKTLDILASFVVLLTLEMVKSEGNMIADVTAAQEFLNEYNRMAEKVYYASSEAAWNYQTNITTENQKVMLDQQFVSAQFSQQAAKNASMYNLTVLTPIMRREFVNIMDIGTSAQTDEVKLKRLREVLAEMETIYSVAKVCKSPQECMSLEPDLVRLLYTSRDYDALLAAWKGWRDVTGPKMKALYTEFVTLSNEAVGILGHADLGAYWRSWYDTPEFEDDVGALFAQLRPLYEHLHAYARRRLIAMYGKDKFPASGHIPAHLLGNMWAQQWSGLLDELTPYKGKQSLDVTDEMVRQGYTPLKIFQTADDFFKSLGMIPMPQEFWDKSMLEKPDDREVVCHASAWDFYNKVDFRVKQCTDVTADHMETAHHEMGHIEYYLQYKNQPVQFRGGANPGFHEAVGDVISLSVQTLEHMVSIGLLQSVSDDDETDINFLMAMALQKIAFLPFGYLIDQWRWSVFKGDTTPEKYNEDWWNLRCRYQGVSPPVARSSSDFDPGAKFHIPGNTPYIRYFVSFVIQFQFHQALCDAAGYKGPLHRCDIYNSTAAGTKLSNMLKLGSSNPWTVAMEMLTGQTKMDAQPLMNYFKPLLEFLRKENGNDFGWHPQCPDLDTLNDPNAGIMVQFSFSGFVILLLLSLCLFL